MLNRVHHVEIDKSVESLGINEQNSVDSLEDSTINIAFFGLDRLNQDENGRSDAIVIISIDLKQDKIKMLSILRDLRVPIENHGMDKINHAYSFGGPQLAIKTLNQNFGTNITDYVAVDYLALEKIIDICGGIDIDIHEVEIPYINEKIAETATINNTKADYITKGGIQLLNGQQAAAYTRVRYVGNGDLERVERQWTVLTKLLNSIKEDGLAQYPGYISKVLPCVETSMDKAYLIKIGMNCFARDIRTIEQKRFPVDGYWKSSNISGIYYIITNLDTTKKHIHNFIG